ncbi:hypothetical protein HGG70_05155 [Rhodobacteraceae bacterium R_SAG4]|nr:hypothetical protein [Rhodobacteraceae bacterium R_SAG4]
MTLFVKNTDTALVGIKATAEVIQRVSGLTSEGFPVLGEVELMQETPELEIRNGQIMFATDEGDTYPAKLVEDRREDGSVVAARMLEEDRPMTENIRALWRAEVTGRRTEMSLADWAENMTEKEWLQSNGLYLAPRDEDINTRFEGEWQITEHYTPGYSQPDGKGGDGIWAIVGDDPEALIEEAISHIRAFYSA